MKTFKKETIIKNIYELSFIDDEAVLVDNYFHSLVESGEFADCKKLLKALIDIGVYTSKIKNINTIEEYADTYEFDPDCFLSNYLIELNYNIMDSSEWNYGETLWYIKKEGTAVLKAMLDGYKSKIFKNKEANNG